MASQGGGRSGGSAPIQSQRTVKTSAAQGKAEASIPSPHAAGPPASSHKAARGYAQAAVVAEARPLGWQRSRTEGGRRHGDTAPQQGNRHAEDVRAAAVKKAAIQRAIHAGATGHYKACDSVFGNTLLPVIPMHLLSQSQATEPTTPTHVTSSGTGGAVSSAGR